MYIHKNETAAKALWSLCSCAEECTVFEGDWLKAGVRELWPAEGSKAFLYEQWSTNALLGYGKSDQN